MADTFTDFPMSFENARNLRCYRAWCTRVVDGDTYDFILDLGMTVRVKARIRLKDFDTAEFFHPSNAAELEHAKLAIAVVAELIADKPCLVRTYRTTSGTDLMTVGRYVADVLFMDVALQFVNVTIPMTQANLAKRASYV